MNVETNSLISASKYQASPARGAAKNAQEHPTAGSLQERNIEVVAHSHRPSPEVIVCARRNQGLIRQRPPVCQIGFQRDPPISPTTQAQMVATAAALADILVGALGESEDVQATADWLREGESQIDVLGKRVTRQPDGAGSWEEFLSGNNR